MHLGVVPAYGIASVESAEYATAFAVLAEELGFESIWVGEHVVMPSRHASRYPYTDTGRAPDAYAHATLPDPVVWLTWAAAATRELRLGSCVVILPQRNPVVLAKQIASLDCLSGGRMLLGVGAGWLREEAVALEERVGMFGFSNEICGENGFGWNRRLMIVHQTLSTPELPEEVAASSRALGAKYGYSNVAAEAAPARIAQILKGLSELLERNRARGSRYFIGDSLTALDIYWATFSNLIEPLPPEQCPIDDAARAMYMNRDPRVAKAARPALMEHREFVYREHLGLPMDL